MKLDAVFKVSNWTEEAYLDLGEMGKMTRSTATYTWTGAVEGQSRVDYLMTYLPSGNCHFVGLERFEGRVNGLEGTFAMQHTGAYKGSGVTADIEIIATSGTGELGGISGRTFFGYGHQDEYPMVFEVEGI